MTSGYRPLFGPHTWQVCEACNLVRHQCYWCGADLDHTEAHPSQYPNREPHPCYAEEQTS